MNANETVEYSNPSIEVQPENDFIEDLFWEGPFGEADCAGL